MSGDDHVIADVSFGGYSILGLPEDRLAPEDLPSPPGAAEPLEGSVEEVEGGAFVWALNENAEDEKVRLIFQGAEVEDLGEPPGTVKRRLAFVASGPVVVNTFDWDFVTTLPIAQGDVELEVTMMPQGPDADSWETHYLRLLS